MPIRNILFYFIFVQREEGEPRRDCCVHAWEAKGSFYEFQGTRFVPFVIVLTFVICIAVAARKNKKHRGTPRYT